MNSSTPDAIASQGTGFIISLQSVLNVIWSNQHLNNALTYAICGLLLIIWIGVTIRSRSTLARDYFALAAISPLSILPVYHRTPDAKLLLLTLPACAMLSIEETWIGRAAVLLNGIVLLLISELPLAVITTVVNDLHISTAGFRGKLLTTFLGRPLQLFLLALSIFYIYVYARRFFSSRSLSRYPLLSDRRSLAGSVQPAPHPPLINSLPCQPRKSRRSFFLTRCRLSFAPTMPCNAAGPCLHAPGCRRRLPMSLLT